MWVNTQQGSRALLISKGKENKMEETINWRGGSGVIQREREEREMNNTKDVFKKALEKHYFIRLLKIILYIVYI